MSRASKLGAASLAAGPSLVITAALADLYLRLPAPIIISWDSVMLVISIAGVAAVIGPFVALPVTAISAGAMRALGTVFAPARSPTAWALAGASLGGVGVWLLEPDANVAFALIVTSALCGWLCRGGEGEC